MRLPRLRGVALFVLIASVSAGLLAQQEDIGFGAVPPHAITTPALTDAQVSGLLTTLDSLLARQTDAAKWAGDAHLHFWRLMNRLQTGQMNSAQEQLVLAAFDRIEKQHPAEKTLIDSYRHVVTTQMIGKVAPEITGKDYDGVEFKLSEYRGKVTVLYFTGQWCGPCRGEYPYERLMLEVHKADPFAIVSVNSDDKIETAKQSKIDNKLEFRSWWDGYVKDASTKGPIASAWNVTGWPAIYVLDEKGVIRFAQLRQEDILKAVSQLLSEQRIAATAKK
jgi:thiol-disulfide isomerase/thioredoxin